MVASGPHLDIHLDTALLSQIICIRLFLCCTIKNKTIDEEQMFSEDFVISFYTIFITILGRERERKREREREREREIEREKERERMREGG